MIFNLTVIFISDSLVTYSQIIINKINFMATITVSILKLSYFYSFTMYSLSKVSMLTVQMKLQAQLSGVLPSSKTANPHLSHKISGTAETVTDCPYVKGVVDGFRIKQCGRPY